MKTSRSMMVLWIVLLLGMVACANPADDVPAASVAEPSGEAAPSEEGAPAEGAVFQAAEGSTVSFIGSKVTGTHEGGFNEFTVAVSVVGGDPTQSSVQIEIDTTSLWSDSEKLTGHLKSPDFFDVEQFPTATFSSTEIVAGETGYTVTGDLNLHGVTKSISFPATIEVAEGGVKTQAEFSIMRFDFGIVYPGRKDDLIRDEVVVKFDINTVPAGA